MLELLQKRSLKSAFAHVRAAILCCLFACFLAVSCLGVLGLSGCTGNTSSGTTNRAESVESFGSVGDIHQSQASAQSDAQSSAQSTSQGNSGTVDLSTDEGIRRKIASMTLEQKVAQLFIVRPGVMDDLTDEDIDPLIQYPMCGFLYMSNDLESPSKTRGALAYTQQRSLEAIGIPVFLCVDEEGGTVSRVADNEAFGVANVGDMAAIGATGDVEAARNAASTIAAYLIDLGFNVDFAPVADLASGDDSMALRSFGNDPNLASSMVAAQVESYLGSGILCSVKHFPGIGGIEEDSHEVSIFSHLSMDEFKASALLPFKAGIDAGAPFVMIGHLSTPEATGDDTPASLSRAWITDVLRNEMGYSGVVITDSLGMGAVCERYSQYNLGALCLEAGADVLLNPADFSAMYHGVLDAAERGELSEARIDESLARVLRVKQRLL